MSIIKIKFVFSLAAFEKEINMQHGFLSSFIPPKQISVQNQRKTIFCGTGDSFAAALLGEVFSDFKVKALDPLDISKNVHLLNGHHLYLISVSGNTLSNIKLARRTKFSTAITSSGKSKLATTCKNLIELKFDKTGIQTAGSISFLASALTCISLVTNFRMPKYVKLFKMAYEMAQKSVHGKVYVLGNQSSFPIALYCAAKFNEVLGYDAHYERIEQFSHMGLFSSRKGDTVIIFEKKNRHNEKLLREIKKCGLHPILIDPPTLDPIGQIIFFIFVSEFLVLHLAKIKNKKECFFVDAKQLRIASSSMIY